MTWASYGDEFSRWPAWDNVSHEARWHYIALVEECCRGCRWDGRLPLSLARRASDVSDPDKCHAELEGEGVLTMATDIVELPLIDHHIPPPAQRPEAMLPRKRQNQAEYRRRRCEEKGIHDKDCPPQTCPVKIARRAQRAKGDALPSALPATPGRDRDGAGSSPRTEERTYEEQVQSDFDQEGVTGDITRDNVVALTSLTNHDVDDPLEPSWAVGDLERMPSFNPNSWKL
jgi:hypothetical protein